MIKYLGSKRALVPVLSELADAVSPRSALDLFSGTTRVAQAFKANGAHVTAVDSAAYAHVLAECYIATAAETVDHRALEQALAHLGALPPQRGYVTEVFCEQARYFHPDNGARIDAIRQGIDDHYADSPLRALLLTSLLLAADAVDSTVGLQMAYLKSWAPRALRPLALKAPVLLPGPGRALHGDAPVLVPTLPSVDLAYLDPPYNQHRYVTNYHVWQTLIRWDAPEHYGVACKRVDSREPHTASVFNRKRAMPAALASLIEEVRAEVVMLSFNDEGFVGLDDLVSMMIRRGQPVAVLGFAGRRYIGSQLGVYNRQGLKVGTAGRRSNTEYVLLSGPDEALRAMRARVAEHELIGSPVDPR